MILRRVYYELFPHEVDDNGSYQCVEDHRLDREIRLEFDLDVTLFVSWISEPVQYCVGHKGSSFFGRGEAVCYEATNQPS